MKRLISLMIGVVCMMMANLSHAQTPENWTSRQLMQPADLAAMLQSTEAPPVIISVGPGATIPHSIHAGMASQPENIAKLKETLQQLPKDKQIVVYCGCCPFDHCPNVRPAIEVLKEMNFTNYYLLNLPNNIKTNWIDKGYPVAESN